MLNQMRLRWETNLGSNDVELEFLPVIVGLFESLDLILNVRFFRYIMI